MPSGEDMGEAESRGPEPGTEKAGSSRVGPQNCDETQSQEGCLSGMPSFPVTHTSEGSSVLYMTPHPSTARD